MSEMIERVASAVLAEAYKTDGIALKVGVAKAIARAALEATRDYLNMTNNSSLNYTADELQAELDEINA